MGDEVSARLPLKDIAEDAAGSALAVVRDVTRQALEQLAGTLLAEATARCETAGAAAEARAARLETELARTRELLQKSEEERAKLKRRVDELVGIVSGKRAEHSERKRKRKRAVEAATTMTDAAAAPPPREDRAQKMRAAAPVIDVLDDVESGSPPPAKKPRSRKSKKALKLRGRRVYNRDDEQSVGSPASVATIPPPAAFPAMARSTSITPGRDATRPAAGSCNDIDDSPSKPRPAVRTTRSPDFAYNEVVRNRAERSRLQGFTCEMCKAFYEACGVFNDNCEHDAVVQAASRHRARYPKPATPEGYWQIGFSSSAEAIDLSPANPPSPRPPPQEAHLRLESPPPPDMPDWRRAATGFGSLDSSTMAPASASSVSSVAVDMDAITQATR
ncbi:uncharacterized protein AMSG_04045 [Thecamonas trahens ATCC 50062]|uniref:DNA endonuclease activator Ctp1 C-terminal domain-containing protein n=1 Tax=Thecamonas trahens ATCC 50062 TaxID=461836 RepID=A0A0L0D6T6_THETB|nr:hypothetical protein AMSG_04045 [Thecamonas trahens ATCC 50062]KNC47816.1 hypothetical protein AMSG_04045 [Thecamonas trahens ATCC 50062]|eukprot:XP_013759294.1 hypothetical protein AMSG_04045 [Thecamonas trahens ATCC 50062]